MMRLKTNRSMYVPVPFLGKGGLGPSPTMMDVMTESRGGSGLYTAVVDVQWSLKLAKSKVKNS